MPKETAKRFIDHYSIISAEEGARRQEAVEAEKLATEAAKLLEDTNIVEPSLTQNTVDNEIKQCQDDMGLEKENAPIENQKSGKGSKKGSPANSGKASPKEEVIKNAPKPASPQKIPSRKGSASNGQELKEKCKTVEE